MVQKKRILAYGLETILVIICQEYGYFLPLYPKNMHMTKLKSYGLTALPDKISTCPSIDFFTGLLVATLIQIYNKKRAR